MNVVILAAGQGKRMNSARPKVLHPIAGKPMLAHVLDTARLLKPARLCVVFGHGGEQVPITLAAPDVTWIKQEPQLGTGHAVLLTLPHLDQALPTLVIYGDVPLIQASTLRKLLEHADKTLALLTVTLADPHGYGRIVRTAGKIKSIIEEKDATASQRKISEINTGILVAPTSALARWLPKLGKQNAQGEYYLTDIVAMAVTERMAVHSVHPAHEWEVQGVNSKLQLAELERIHQHNTAAKLLDQSVTLADPFRIDVRGELTCGRDVSIDINCVFEGKVVLEDSVSVGPHCLLRDVTVKRGARIEAFSHLQDAVVGEESIVGPYARLRPGAKLGKDVHIGNFVEVKNSNIDDHSKANHLAYIGDADIGQRVNVGAGTITCNYDGANKHRTVIEDDVFIGSDTQLVAPVTVGRGATLGAGTTLTKNAPPNQLTVSRAKQVSITGWVRPLKKK
jgi:bifunctional UDP-N-acetylglucosamine pyrophosphorylase/glucosamine-1-phosphate N-acetyltransferase